MNSFDKSFLILETVVLQNGVPTTPTTVSKLTGIHLVTCSRVMGALAKSGYLERVSAHLGYVAGPMCLSLGTRPNVYSRLANAARRPLRDFSELIQGQVNLSVDFNHQRIMLACENPQQNYRFWQRFRFDYDGGAATDRLLLSALNPDYPGREEILRTKHVEFIEQNTAMIIMGELITVEGYPPAAFGYGFSQSLDVERIREASRQTALKIEHALAPLPF